MKRLLLLAAFALMPGPALAANDSKDAGAILRTVIRQEARDLRSWSSGPLACAKSAIEGSTFEGLRRTRQTLPGSASPVQDRLPVSAAFRYRRQPSDPDGRMAELEPGEVRELADAIAAIVAEKAGPPLVTKLRSEWLTLPFRLCSRKRFGLLRLSSPVIHGDLAFVSLDFDCVLCGHGIDYALRRRGDGWQIISENMRWVS